MVFYYRREDIKEKAIQDIQHQETPPKDDVEHHEESSDQNPFHKFGKTGCLVFVWLIMVMFLTSTPEKVLERRQLAIPIAEPRIYNFTQLPRGTRINATLSGAFLSSETKLDKQMKKQESQQDYILRKSPKDFLEKENYIRVFLQSSSGSQLTSPRVYEVAKPELFDTYNISKIVIMFDIGEDNLNALQEDKESLQLVIESNFTKTLEKEKLEMPLIFTYDIEPVNKQLGVIFASFCLIFLYALIIWEVRNFIFCIYIKIRINFLTKH